MTVMVFVMIDRWMIFIAAECNVVSIKIVKMLNYTGITLHKTKPSTVVKRM